MCAHVFYVGMFVVCVCVCVDMYVCVCTGALVELCSHSLTPPGSPNDFQTKGCVSVSMETCSWLL